MFGFLRLTTMAILASLSVAVAAAVPGKMNFQGYLTTAAGAPISGTVSITFTLYDAPASGTAIWQETQSVTPSGGVYNVVLGASTPIDAPVILPSGQLWLGVKVGADLEMTPRQQVLAAGYSIRSAVADLATTASSVPGSGITGTVPFAALPVGTGAGTVAAGNDARFADSRPVGSVPRTNTNSLVDASGSTGFYTSITIGSDGLPVISYIDLSGNGTLKVAKCGDAACSTGNTLATVAVGNANGPTSIAIGTDGFPVIAYVDISAGDLKVAKCGNAACSSANAIVVVDPGGAIVQRYQWASLAIGADGLPVISYTDNSLGDLKVATCGNPGCSSGNSIATVDAAGSTGYYTAIAVAADGLPVISYGSPSSSTLNVAKCGNASCTSGNTSSTVDAVSAVETSIAIGSDGLPVIAYQNGLTQDLRVAKCGNPACASGNVIATVDSAGNVGENSSIAIGPDGLPIVSYRDGTNLHLKVAKCGDASCSANNFITTLATGAQYGRFSSITIGADGLPVVSFPELDSYDLRVIKCANAFCANNFTRR